MDEEKNTTTMKKHKRSGVPENGRTLGPEAQGFPKIKVHTFLGGRANCEINHRNVCEGGVCESIILTEPNPKERRVPTLKNTGKGVGIGQKAPNRTRSSLPRLDASTANGAICLRSSEDREVGVGLVGGSFHIIERCGLMDFYIFPKKGSNAEMVHHFPPQKNSPNTKKLSVTAQLSRPTIYGQYEWSRSYAHVVCADGTDGRARCRDTQNRPNRARKLEEPGMIVPDYCRSLQRATTTIAIIERMMMHSDPLGRAGHLPHCRAWELLRTHLGINYVHNTHTHTFHPDPSPSPSPGVVR